MHHLEPGRRIRPPITTANYQFCVVKGEGSSIVGGRSISWSRGDVFVCPCWTPQEHYSEDGAVIFEITDEPLQRYCGYLRQDHGAALASAAERLAR
jgi:gentisate 1,2-dioxygenase